MAAQAHWTSSVLSQGAPLRSRDDLPLPALSFWPADRPAQETRCPSLANRLISVPVSARIEVAAKLAMPGIPRRPRKLLLRAVIACLALNERRGSLIGVIDGSGMNSLGARRPDRRGCSPLFRA